MDFLKLKKPGYRSQKVSCSSGDIYFLKESAEGSGVNPD